MSIKIIDRRNVTKILANRLFGKYDCQFRLSPMSDFKEKELVVLQRSIKWYESYRKYPYVWIRDYQLLPDETIPYVMHIYIYDINHLDFAKEVAQILETMGVNEVFIRICDNVNS